MGGLGYLPREICTPGWDQQVQLVMVLRERPLPASEQPRTGRMASDARQAMLTVYLPVQVLPGTGPLPRGLWEGSGCCPGAELGCLGGAAPGDRGRAGYVPAMVDSRY